MDTLERIEIIQRFTALGVFDVLVGINLLREGLDIPECQLVAILDADKEGFLRSKRSLIQTIGRAARNVGGKAVLYADKITDSMKYAMDETARRREKQEEYNKEHGITPASIKKNISDILQTVFEKSDRVQVARGGMTDQKQIAFDSPEDLQKQIKTMEKQMHEAASNLEFEEAARLRDEISKLRAADLGLTGTASADSKRTKTKDWAQTKNVRGKKGRRK